MACIQTVPGMELRVAENLKNALSINLKSQDFTLMKAFGAFDIILLYAAPSFDYYLTKAGTIQGIQKSNLFYCFPYLAQDSDTILKNLSETPFTGFSFVKIDPAAHHLAPEIEQQLIQVLGKHPATLVLGTLGWNEIVLLVNGKSIGDIFDALFSISQMMVGSHPKGPFHPIFVKTFSFIGMNYRLLPRLSQIKKGLQSTKRALDQSPSLRKRVPKSHLPSISISCEPMFAGDIASFWNKQGFDSFGLLGKSDITVRPQKQISWSKFISCLLYFRYDYRAKAIATSTIITGEIPTPSPPGHLSKVPIKVPKIDYPFDTLRRIFGKGIAGDLANHFYQLNSLTQNRIIGYAFQDMVEYPRHVVTTAKALKKGLKGSREGAQTLGDFARNCWLALPSGAELRSYGTYGALEEVAGRFSKARGGAQRALLSLEFVPSYVLDRIGGAWDGFVITGGGRFAHIGEVINVPTRALWKPQIWWALYHEVGHVLIDNWKDVLVSDKIPVVRQFLINKTDPNSWLRLLEELVAEVFGFELGFFGDFKLFMKRLWKYLVSLPPMSRKLNALQIYAFRTFFVSLFKEHFRAGNVRKQEWQNADLLFEGFVDHMDWIETITGSQARFPDKYFIAAKNVEAFRELFAFAEYLSVRMSELPPLGRNAAETRSENTRAAVRDIMAGKVFWENIHSPEAVLYHLFKKERLGFPTSIATVLTFWHCMVLKMRKTIDVV